MIGVIVGVIACCFVAAAFWDEIADWVTACIRKLRKACTDCKVLFKKVGKKIIETLQMYYRVGNQWYITSETRTVSESEVPEDIIKKFKYENQEIDVTDKLKLQN